MLGSVNIEDRYDVWSHVIGVIDVQVVTNDALKKISEKLVVLKLWVQSCVVKELRKLERDLEDENGEDGVNSTSFKKWYPLAIQEDYGGVDGEGLPRHNPLTTQRQTPTIVHKGCAITHLRQFYISKVNFTVYLVDRSTYGDKIPQWIRDCGPKFI